MNCGVGCRHGSDLAWLWCRLAAVAPIKPPAWELPYASGVALKIKKKKKKYMCILMNNVAHGNTQVTITQKKLCQHPRSPLCVPFWAQLLPFPIGNFPIFCSNNFLAFPNSFSIHACIFKQYSFALFWILYRDTQVWLFYCFAVFTQYFICEIHSCCRL